MRLRVVVPLVAAIAVTGSAAVVLVTNIHPASSAKRPPSVVASRPPVLDGLATDARVPTRVAVARAVDRALDRFPEGEQVIGTVVDVASGASLWDMHPDSTAAPASTLKLLTAAAALRTLGPEFRFATSTRRVGSTVYLVGGGDPTIALSSSPSDLPAAYPIPASLTELALETASELPHGRSIALRFDDSAWTGPATAPGWLPNYIREGDVTPPSALELDGGRLTPDDFDSRRTTDPSDEAAEAFAALLRQDGVAVNESVTPGVAPRTSRRVAVVSSPPLANLVQRMLTDSDNDLAEALGRAVALHDRLPPSFAGAASAVASTVSRLGVPKQSVSLFDASGLSHDDRVAPTALVAVLRAAALAHPGDIFGSILEGLPVAGFTGTLAERYRGKPVDPGAGVVRAKTGSLTGVNALAGLVVDRSGRLLAFALLGSGSKDTGGAENGLDAVASALARLS